MKARNIQNVVVTGGAGFIGSHTVDLLIERKYNVTILDNLDPQVHGEAGKIPDYVNSQAAFVRGDVRDREIVKKVLREADAVIHLAAMLGVGQSMYQIERYVDVSTRGTANILDVLVNEENNVKKVVVASSMSVYGEGKYRCPKCLIDVNPRLRDNEQLKNKQWEHKCEVCHSTLTPVPTDEEKPLVPNSIYALTKRHQEEMCLLIGKTYGIPTIALRYLNVYGSRQSLSNPYTGCLAIFSSRILNGKSPYVFEDGNQQRDFVHVKDIARGNLAALEHSSGNYNAINIGSGVRISIKELAQLLAKVYDRPDLQPFVANEYRQGDVRHLYADIQKARRLLEYKPSVFLEEGLRELGEWGKAHKWGAIDLFDKALSELKSKHLVS
jgi:dTDP-L-rhamnose 4-epimerase